MVRPRKGAVQIRFEILEYLCFRSTPQPKTHVWRRATTLSYDVFLKHLEGLTAKGLVREVEDGSCTIIAEGRGVYDKLRIALSSIL
jgi:predicted transcriptional regulator